MSTKERSMVPSFYKIGKEIFTIHPFFCSFVVVVLFCCCCFLCGGGVYFAIQDIVYQESILVITAGHVSYPHYFFSSLSFIFNVEPTHIIYCILIYK